MNNRLNNRRRFLKQISSAGVVAGVGSGLSTLNTACSYFDDKVLGFRPDPSDKVLILGGGIAGLSAAYLLKKRNIPFVMFESSPRFGGRIYTLQNINESRQYAELGGEWIDDSYEGVFALAKELKVPLDTFPGWNVPVDRSTIEYLTKITEIFEQRSVLSVEPWRAMDAVPLSEWMYRERDRLPTVIQEDIVRWTRLIWGAEPQEISAAFVIENILPRIRKRREKTYRIRGGATEITSILAQRSIGLVPESKVYFNSRLVSLKQQSNDIKLYFETPEGEKAFTTRKVICTIPFTNLRNIEGVEEMNFSSQHMQLIKGARMGAHTKIALGYPDRFWKSSMSRVSLTKDNRWITWEVTESPFGDILAGEGVLQFQSSGEAARKVGTEAFNAAEEALKMSFNFSSANLIKRNFEHILNWQLLKNSSGSTSFLAPGMGIIQRNAAYLDLDKMWYFAGEHTSRSFAGTIEGAVESARRAVGQLVNE